MRSDWLEIKVEAKKAKRRTEVLATLVNEETATLLEWLVDRTTQVILETACIYGSNHPLVVQQNERVETARALAVRIRKLLEE